MIDTVCTCGQPVSAAESAVPTVLACPSCKTSVHLVTSEPLGDGMGVGDFDACFVVGRGPGGDREGHVYCLGGVAPIAVGKLSTSNVLLPASGVSRHHATLTRLDFGPSRWQIEDRGSKNGVWVNGRKVEGAYELGDGDHVVIGEYELRYRHAPEARPVRAAAVGHGVLPGAQAAGRACPSCGRVLAADARICVDCGIYVDTGRPLITSKAIDREELETKAYKTLRWVSFVSPTGLMPIASEGFGTKKPYVLWALFMFTIFTSVVGFIADRRSDPYRELPATANLMLWAGNPGIEHPVPRPEDIHGLSPEKKAEYIKLLENRPLGKYGHHQLVTHAFLHGGLFHLAGNMLFLVVLGLAVNALIGNLQMAVVYPLLAAAGAVAHMADSRDQPPIPMVGASGAIMGLAGMYLVLFPVHRMYMAIWVRWFFVKLSWKVWGMRGFWVVLFYISFDVLYTLLGVRDETAHWAHLGGFIAGVGIGLFLLLTRLVNARGGDLISVVLGRHAWKLLGKPASRNVSTVPKAPGVAVTSMNYPG